MEAAEGPQESVSASLNQPQGDLGSTVAFKGPLPALPKPFPKSFRDGRYEIKAELGEGATKKVLLARDTLLDREVAFALIKSEGLDDIGRQRVLREAQTMARLGDHPNIVQLFDFGEEGGQTYMVLPLMPGGDVEALILSAPDHRLPLERTLELAKQVCRGLEFAHSRGMVHRDLKPSNVWLSSSGSAMIGDFGLAISIDGPRITQENIVVGTVSYMPPEQATGGELVAQSDLYALGCMLYHLVTGKPPFQGSDIVAVISQHVNTPPVPPVRHLPSCPTALDALIMRLLAKEPSDRPESASDVLTALEGVDIAAGEADPSAERPNAMDSLVGGVFVGRQRQMGQLKAVLEQTLSGRGALLTLVGDAGIGKTRLATEFSSYAGLRRAKVLWGRCHESRGAPPYWPWVQALRPHVRESDPDELRTDLGPNAAEVAEIVTDLREVLPGLPGPPALGDTEQARFRLFDSIATYLKNSAARKPLVLVLEDIHWADRPSLLLLEFVARELATSRMLVVATYRELGLSRQHPLSESLGELSRERLFNRIDLTGLLEKDIAEFMEETAGVSPPPGLVSEVHAKTQGNPFFVTEVVRLMVQEGDPVLQGKPAAGRSTRERTWTFKIPEGVREVIGRRLGQLSEECNQTLTVAAVIGPQFTLSQLTPLHDDMSVDRLLEVLGEALAARVVSELPSTMGAYRFTEALIQETLTSDLSATRKVRLHARIAETLESLYADDLEEHAAELARHYAEGAAVTGSEKLVRYSLIAGERALESYGYEEALPLLQRAISARGNAGDEGETGRLFFGLGRAQAGMGRLGDAVESLTRAFDHYDRGGDTAHATAVAKYPVIAMPGVQGLTKLISRALELVPDDSVEAGELLSRHIRPLAVENGDYAGAQQAAVRALRIAERENDTALEMRTLAEAGDVDGHNMRFEAGLEKVLRAVSLAEKVEEPHAESAARYWATTISRITGDFEASGVHAAAGLDLAERMRDRFRQGTGLLAGGELARLKGDWDAAREFAEKGLAVQPREPTFLALRALLEHELGDAAQGEIFRARLADHIRQARPDPSSLFVYCLTTLPAIARITGDTQDLEGVRGTLEGVLASPHATRLVGMSARVGLALIASQSGDASAMREYYDELSNVDGVLLSHWPLGRLLGVLGVALGEDDRWTGHFDDGLELCRRAGAKPELAWTCYDYAEALIGRDDSGDGDRAGPLLKECLAISRDLRMKPLSRRATSLQDQVS